MARIQEVFINLLTVDYVVDKTCRYNIELNINIFNVSVTVNVPCVILHTECIISIIKKTFPLTSIRPISRSGLAALSKEVNK